ncbi:MAG: hypothetical protein F6K62_25560 [Sphaerospermopsis sp. SIO1G2]|nr:hypothetical protein [Sphaerospermopsis sp. SIO1G2]
MQVNASGSGDQPAFGKDLGDAGAFIADLQQRAQAVAPTLSVLPKPVEVERYQRKRQQDWDDNDTAWLPLSLMKKIATLQDAGDRALKERLGIDRVSWSIEGLHDDFRVVVDFTKKSDTRTTLPTEQFETAQMFLQSAFRDVHPHLTVEEPKR